MGWCSSSACCSAVVPTMPSAVRAGRWARRGRLGRVEQGHGCLGEVAAVEDLPLVGRLDQHAAGQPEQGGAVGEDADDVAAPLDLLAQPFSGLLPILRQCACGKSAKAVISSRASRISAATLELPLQGRRHVLDRFTDCVGDGLGEDGADRRGNYLRLALARAREHVAHKRHPAALPGRTSKHRVVGVGQPAVGVDDPPARPRSRSSRRKPVQNTSFSLSPTSHPSTSRRPSAETPVAMTTARKTTRPLTPALQ